MVAAYNVANAHNNDTLDVKGQGAIEAPPIRTIDDAAFAELRGRGEATLGESGTIDQVRVFVPEQSGFPQQFLASERATGSASSFRQLLVFSKTSESDPWQSSMAVQLLVSKVPKLLTSAAGTVERLDADHAASLKVRPAALGKALADVWAKAGGEERASHPEFAKGPLTDGVVDVFVNQLSRMGISGRLDISFSPSELPVVGYRTADGGALCFVVMQVHESLAPAIGSAFAQGADHKPYGGLIKPGTYGQLRYERLVILALLVPRAVSKAHVRAIGIYDGVVSATPLSSGTSTA